MGITVSKELGDLSDALAKDSTYLLQLHNFVVRSEFGPYDQLPSDAEIRLRKENPVRGLHLKSLAQDRIQSLQQEVLRLLNIIDTDANRSLHTGDCNPALTPVHEVNDGTNVNASTALRMLIFTGL